MLCELKDVVDTFEISYSWQLKFINLGIMIFVVGCNFAESFILSNCNFGSSISPSTDMLVSQT